MFVFVDESGNTDAHLFDEAQPIFLTVALKMRADFDTIYARSIAELVREIEDTQLHADKLGVARIEEIGAASWRLRQWMFRCVRQNDFPFYGVLGALDAKISPPYHRAVGGGMSRGCARAIGDDRCWNKAAGQILSDEESLVADRWRLGLVSSGGR